MTLSRLIKAEGDICVATGLIFFWTVNPFVGSALVGAGLLKCRTARALARRGW